MSKDETVSVIDDDAGMLKSLRMVFEAAGFDTTAYASAEEFLDCPRNGTTNCIVLDLRLTGMGGLELLELLRSRQNTAPVIIITGHGDVQSAVRAMKLGAADFLEKPIDHHELVAKVQEAVAAYGDHLLKEAAVETVRQRLAPLTARERELLKLLADGKSSKQISLETKLSIKTVENHRSHLLAKSGALNMPDLVRMSVKAGLL